MRLLAAIEYFVGRGKIIMRFWLVIILVISFAGSNYSYLWFPLKICLNSPSPSHPRNRSLLYASSLFEGGPMASSHKEFHDWWKKHYQYPGSPLNKMKIRLLPKTNRALARFFIRKKPLRQMLRLSQQQDDSSPKN